MTTTDILKKCTTERAGDANEHVVLKSAAARAVSIAKYHGQIALLKDLQHAIDSAPAINIQYEIADRLEKLNNMNHLF